MVTGAADELTRLAPVLNQESGGAGKIPLVDASGRIIVRAELRDGSNLLNINDNGSVDVNIVGGGSSGTEYTDGGTPPANPEGPTLLWNDGGAWKHVSGTDPLPVTAALDTTGLATEAKQDTGNTALSAIRTAVQLIDNMISDNEAQVDVITLPELPAGANLIGDVGIKPRTSGGLSIFKSIDLDESEEEVKGSAGQVFSIVAFNLTAAPLFLKLYNATAANVTVGTTTPVATFVVPANADSDGAGFVWNNDIGLAFSTAICAAVTTGVADNDTGAPAANACVVMIGYS